MVRDGHEHRDIATLGVGVSRHKYSDTSQHLHQIAGAM